jgi:hypothetical protein
MNSAVYLYVNIMIWIDIRPTGPTLECRVLVSPENYVKKILSQLRGGGSLWRAARPFGRVFGGFAGQKERRQGNCVLESAPSGQTDRRRQDLGWAALNLGRGRQHERGGSRGGLKAVRIAGFVQYSWWPALFLCVPPNPHFARGPYPSEAGAWWYTKKRAYQSYARNSNRRLLSRGGPDTPPPLN